MIIIAYIIGYLFGKKFPKKNKDTELKEKINFYKEIQGFVTYSQILEDFILFCIFYDIKNGFYIDIGANDPNTDSVTKAFYLRGWHGINIEPLPDKYKFLLLKRNRDINLNIGVGKNEGNGTLYIGGIGGQGSTLFKKYIKKKKKFIKIKIYSMKNICVKYVSKYQEIHFVKIDVEGGEKDVLLGYDFINYRPKVFCIEATKPGTKIPTHHLWEKILIKNNYSFVYQYIVNRYYIDNKVRGLKERFNRIDKLIKKFRKNNLKKK